MQLKDHASMSPGGVGLGEAGLDQMPLVAQFTLFQLHFWSQVSATSRCLQIWTYFILTCFINYTPWVFLVWEFSDAPKASNCLLQGISVLPRSTELVVPEGRLSNVESSGWWMNIFSPLILRWKILSDIYKLLRERLKAVTLTKCTSHGFPSLLHSPGPFSSLGSSLKWTACTHILSSGSTSEGNTANLKAN